MTEEQRAREVLRRYGLHRGDITKLAQMLSALTAFADETRLAEREIIAEDAYHVMLNWRLSTMCQEDEPSEGYPLVDAVSTNGMGIDTGEEELREIAHAIITAIREPRS